MQASAFIIDNTSNKYCIVNFELDFRAFIGKYIIRMLFICSTMEINQLYIQN